MIKVSVYYSPEEGQLQAETVLLDKPSTVLEVIKQSQLYKDYPKVLQATKVAIFSQETSLDEIVYGEERIELCRPLLLDPKEARRLRAKKKN